MIIEDKEPDFSTLAMQSLESLREKRAGEDLDTWCYLITLVIVESLSNVGPVGKDGVFVPLFPTLKDEEVCWEVAESIGVRLTEFIGVAIQAAAEAG